MKYQRSLYLFMLPSFLLLAVVLLYPLGYGLYLSLFNYYLPSGTMSWVGLGNYWQLLTEGRFWSSLLTTFEISLAAVALEFAVGFLIALGLYKVLEPIARAYTVLLFLPQIITPVVAALFLRWMFVAQFGLIEVVFTQLGIVSPDWLGSPVWAKVTVIFADGWQYTPFFILVLFAGLQGLDRSLLEAGAIDGASGWKMVWYIVLPALRPIILFVLAIRIMDAIRMFDSIYVLTGGGPGTATETLSVYTYTLAFRSLEIGRASALGVLTMVFITALIGLLIRWLYRKEGGAF